MTIDLTRMPPADDLGGHRARAYLSDFRRAYPQLSIRDSVVFLAALLALPSDHLEALGLDFSPSLRLRSDYRERIAEALLGSKVALGL